MQPLKGMHFFVDILGVPALANGCSGEVVTDLLAQAPAYERQQQAILVFVAWPAGSAICLHKGAGTLTMPVISRRGLGELPG